MLALLEKGDLPGDRATSEGGKPSEGVRDVRDLLLSSVRPGANYRQFSLALDGLERLLAAQLVVIEARTARGWDPFTNSAPPCARAPGSIRAFRGRPRRHPRAKPGRRPPAAPRPHIPARRQPHGGGPGYRSAGRSRLCRRSLGRSWCPNPPLCSKLWANPRRDPRPYGNHWRKRVSCRGRAVEN